MISIQRRIQLGAATVVATGLLALSLLPTIALANPCSSFALCKSQCGTQSQDTAWCQAAAPAGCTVTSTACGPIRCQGAPVSLICFFQ
jgi:hypothetical protein